MSPPMSGSGTRGQLKLQSIGVLLQAIIGLMAAALLVVFAVSAKHAYEREALAQHTVVVVATAQDLFTGTPATCVRRWTGFSPCRSSFARPTRSRASTTSTLGIWRPSTFWPTAYRPRPSARTPSSAR